MPDPQPGDMAGDESYTGFRISEMWAVTAIDPEDDQEGIIGIPGPNGGTIPAVGSDRMRKQSFLDPLLADARAAGLNVQLKRFTLVQDGAGEMQAAMPESVPAVELHSDPDWRAYVTHVEAELIPKIQESGMTISLVPKGETDVKFAIELGLSIMLNKPIMAVVQAGSEVPAKLSLVADEIVEIDFEAGQDVNGPKIAEAMYRMTKRFG